MVGGCSTVKSTLLLVTPPTTTVTGPLVALFGTSADYARGAELVGRVRDAVEQNLNGLIGVELKTRAIDRDDRSRSGSGRQYASDGRIRHCEHIVVELLGIEFTTTTTGPVVTLLGGTA